MKTLVTGGISDVRNEAASALYNYVCDANGCNADPERVKEAFPEDVLRSFISIVTGPNLEAALLALRVLHIVLHSRVGLPMLKAAVEWRH